MKTIILIAMVSILFLPVNAHAEAILSPCPSNEILAAELLEFEISGVRVAGAKPNCVDKEKYPHVKTEAPLIAEASAKPVPFKVSETKPFTVRSTRPNKTGQIEVLFAWNTAGEPESRAVLDKMEMTRYDGANRKYFGCAVMTLRPKQAAVRPSCLSK